MMKSLLKMVVGFVGKDKIKELITELIAKLIAEKNSVTLSEGEDDVVLILYEHHGRPCSIVAVTGVDDNGEGMQRTFIARTLTPVYIDDLVENFLKPE